MKVGITWCGSPTQSNDAFRSTTLDRFRPLVEVPGVSFYSLQIGPPAEALSHQGPEYTVVRDLSQAQRDLADTAAILRQLDLVITVDTSLLHLSAGMGLPTWGLISKRSDWRWHGHDQTSSRWYPSLRLFRQRRLNDWDELMKRVAAELRIVVSARSSNATDS